MPPRGGYGTEEGGHCEETTRAATKPGVGSRTDLTATHVRMVDYPGGPWSPACRLAT
jgi:hypothetical protein